MKPLRLSAPLCFLTLFCSSPALAVDGTITITGEITDQTCKIDGNLPPHNIMVTLPRIGASALRSNGETAGATVFTIRVTDCPSALTGQLKLYFEPGSTTDYGTGNLIAYKEAAPSEAAGSIPDRSAAMVFQNVQIQLANLDGSTIRLGEPLATQNVKSVALVATSGATTKEATLRYLARYVRVSDNTLNAGKVVSYVQYSVVYP